MPAASLVQGYIPFGVRTITGCAPSQPPTACIGICLSIASNRPLQLELQKTSRRCSIQTTLPRYAPIFAIASPVTWPPASVTLHRGRYIFARTAQETSDNTAHPNYRSSSCMMHMYFTGQGLSGTRMTVCSSLPPPVRHESRCATLPSIGHSLAELKSFIFAAL